MKVLIQRVTEAKVTIDEVTKGNIGNGYLLYICFEEGDTQEQVSESILKILKLRIFEDSENKMNLNINEVSGSILTISQFTLSWDGKKGHRPSFTKSLAPNSAKILYKLFNDQLASHGLNVERGIFGTDMKVYSVNDGPVTFFIEF